MENRKMTNIIDLALRCCENVSRVTSLGEISGPQLFSNVEWDTEGFVGTYGDKLIVTFQGSNSSIDWKKVNFRFWKKIIPYNNVNPKILVHAGFINAYKSVRDFLLTQVKESGLKEVWCFGHSLGGAMATLASVDFQYNFPGLVVKVVTFGSPRIGNKAFQASYTHRVPENARVVNGNDLVTRLPPKMFNYEHVGECLHVGDKYRWWKFWGSADHDLGKYKDNIQK